MLFQKLHYFIFSILLFPTSIFPVSPTNIFLCFVYASRYANEKLTQTEQLRKQCKIKIFPQEIIWNKSSFVSNPVAIFAHDFVECSIQKHTSIHTLKQFSLVTTTENFFKIQLLSKIN